MTKPLEESTPPSKEPWTLEIERHNGWPTFTITAESRISPLTNLVILDDVPMEGDTEEEQMANAKAMNAAPDLLEAARAIDKLGLVIESAVRNADPDYKYQVIHALLENKRAIEKATE